ncbi:MAG TPA: META domain-containing protein, partial [Propionibacteriaceae bacterium]|nr:META domain-containing protein [Propionibacteriaceae bacterium]
AHATPRTKPKLWKRALLGVVVLAMVAVAAVAIYSRVNPLWGEWESTELTLWDGPSIAVEQVTMDFTILGEVRGRAGCNHYGADYAIEGGTLRLNDGYHTLMGCDTIDRDIAEEFWEVVLDAPTITRDGSVLVLESPAGKLTLRKTGFLDKETP